MILQPGDLAAIVLAGGEGSRIGGCKPLLRVGGERLIDRAVRLARTYSDFAAVAVRNPAQVPDLDAELIQDEAVEGPLGGLVAGLRFARKANTGFLLVIPADTPFLPADLLLRLGEAIGVGSCAVSSSGGRIHPVCSLWRTNVAARIEAYVAMGRRSLLGLADFVGAATAEWPGGPNDPFLNINSAEDWEIAERRFVDAD